MERLIRTNHNLLGIYSISDIKRHHSGHFFDAGAMRFFKSRVLSAVFCGTENVYFVTSESFDGTSRFFTVRKLNMKTRSIDTVSEFSKLSRSTALSEAIQAAYNESILK